MSNVVQLFAHGQIEHPADGANPPIAMADFLAVLAELGGAIEEFSRHLDSIDRCDRSGWKPESRTARDELRAASANAVLELSQAIRMLPMAQIRAVLDPAQSSRGDRRRVVP